MFLWIRHRNSQIFKFLIELERKSFRTRDRISFSSINLNFKASFELNDFFKKRLKVIRHNPQISEKKQFCVSKGHPSGARNLKFPWWSINDFLSSSCAIFCEIPKSIILILWVFGLISMFLTLKSWWRMFWSCK